MLRNARRVALTKRGLRADGAFQQIQGQTHGLFLRLWIVGLAPGITQGEVAEQKTRHAALFNDIFRTTHDDGGHAIGFEITCGQTHGLMAHRSSRDNDSRFGAILP